MNIILLHNFVSAEVSRSETLRKVPAKILQTKPANTKVLADTKRKDDSSTISEKEKELTFSETKYSGDFAGIATPVTVIILFVLIALASLFWRKLLTKKRKGDTNRGAHLLLVESESMLQTRD